MSILPIIRHDFNGNLINQSSENSVINGVLIPKGYVNATEMCVANGKRLEHYWDNKKTTEFITEYKSVHRNSGERVIIPIQGGNAEYQGTWVHLDIALHLAVWASPAFAVWAMKTLAAVIQGDFKALTAEAEEAQTKLRELWGKIRRAGKVSRRTMTDSIKEWYERNPGATSRPYNVMFSVTTNALYKKLWGMLAIEIEDFLRCGRNEARDFMSAECLKVLERAEARVAEFIDEDNIKPIDAVEAAGLRTSKVALERRGV